MPILYFSTVDCFNKKKGKHEKSTSIAFFFFLVPNRKHCGFELYRWYMCYTKLVYHNALHMERYTVTYTHKCIQKKENTYKSPQGYITSDTRMQKKKKK